MTTGARCDLFVGDSDKMSLTEDNPLWDAGVNFSGGI